MGEILFKRPELEDQDLIKGYYNSYPSRSCERTFVNNYLWSRRYKAGFAIVEGTLVFQSQDYDMAFSFPAGADEDVKKALETLEQYAKEQGISFALYHVTPDQFEKLEAWYPGKYEIEYVRDVADYIYESEKLTTLSGKKLHAKRNHINKFKTEFTHWNYETMTEEHLEECFQMSLQWCQNNDCYDDEEKRAEICVTQNALRLFQELDLTGGVLRIDGDIVAFCIGEPISEDTFVVHIEKAHAGIQGAYPMINQQFVEHECKNYKYINREDDAGSEGLRKAKLSYRPAFLVEKGIVKEKIQ